MAKKLTDFKVLTFDCYGTLIDWESGIWDAMQPLFLENACTTVTRGTGLGAFAEEESVRQTETPDMLYPDVLTHVHGALAQRFGLRTTRELDAAFGASVSHWPAFPDTADALRVLKAHYKLVILSNVNRDGFAASNRKLGVAFDAVYTAEDIGTYKPDPGNFAHMLAHLRDDFDLGADDILHTAQSLFHDHVPASKFGLTSAWIDRQGLADGGAWGATMPVADRPQIDFLYATLGAVADAVAAAGR